MGTVFKTNTDGGGYTALKSFSGGDGRLPGGELLLAGQTLYGTTWEGGSANAGTVFKLSTNGTDFTLLKSFIGGADGFSPAGA